jgi:hypothetical protein
MADREYPMSLFALPMSSIDAKDIINGETGHYVTVKSEHVFDIDIFEEADEGDKRYSYNVLNLPQSGTVFLKLSERVQAGFGNKINIDTRDAQTIVKEAHNSVKVQGTVFTVFWVILILAELIGFGYWVWIYEP